jgi:uncharacterized protein (TIGR02646 family)
MRLLIRGVKPAVLDEFNSEEHDWDANFKSQHKAQVWEKLFDMQGYRCAYCECSLDLSDPEEKHIEHFRQKGRVEYKRLTFEWTNLFGSCCHGNRCGRYKDKSGLSSEDIIKMDEEDPEIYFQFLSSGGIHIRDDLSAEQKRKAEITLNAFNLNPRRGEVKYERERIIKTHRYIIDEMLKMVNEVKSEADMGFLIEIRDEYIKKVSDRPFVTAIKHVLVSRWESSF